MQNKQKKLNYSFIVNIICLLLLIGVIIYLFVVWDSLPDKVPGHYNLAGEIDRMGSKYELLITPIIAWLMFLGLTAIERHPEVWNTGVTITKENKERVYRILRNMISTLKLIIVIVFLYMAINSSLSIPFPAWFTPTYIFLIFATLIFYIIRLVKAK